ncbi:unnamed protein product, partial [Chrysoparadoxa australica]
MRQVALVRLCYGDVNLEMVQAVCDLGSCYMQQLLWQQVSAHMNRASQLLMLVRSEADVQGQGHGHGTTLAGHKKCSLVSPL